MARALALATEKPKRHPIGGGGAECHLADGLVYAVARPLAVQLLDMEEGLHDDRLRGLSWFNELHGV